MALQDAARSGGGISHGASGATQAVRRIQRELKEINESPSKHWTASPAHDDLFEWQFAVRGPPASDFEGGIYTGRLALPVNYPLAPPSITLLTPNGRWEIGKKICLSNTSYHPELWQPAWGIRTMIEALRSHFLVPGDGAVGAIDWPVDLRKKLAKESLEFVCTSGKRNSELLPELSMEERKEDQPDPTPSLPRVLPEAVAVGNSAVAPDASAANPCAYVSAVAPAAQADDAIVGLPEGMRQRHATADGGGSSTVPSLPPLAVLTATVPAAPARRHREAEGSHTQRRPQHSLIVQILKPPKTSRGWVLLVINILIALLTVSFLLIFADIIKNPPKLLYPLPESKFS